MLHPRMLLLDDPLTLQCGQWLFDRSAYSQALSKKGVSSTEAADTAHLLHIVISDATALQEHPQDDIVRAIKKQVQAQTVRFGAMPRVTGHDLIIEKRATFAAGPDLAQIGRAHV